MLNLVYIDKFIARFLDEEIDFITSTFDIR